MKIDQQGISLFLCMMRLLSSRYVLQIEYVLKCAARLVCIVSVVDDLVFLKAHSTGGCHCNSKACSRTAELDYANVRLQSDGLEAGSVRKEITQ